MMGNQYHIDGFTPSLFIGVGETVAYFTLRETYLHEIYIPGDGPMGGCVNNGVYQGQVVRSVRSMHHFNLAQDPGEAFDKAAMVAQSMGMDLTTKREDMQDMMRDIHRSNEEEMRAKRLAEAIRVNHYVDTQADRWTMEGLTQVPRGVFPFGKHEGKTFAEVNKFDRGYLEFMAKDKSDYIKNAEQEIRRLWLETYLEKNPPAIEENDDYVGEIGARIEANVIVKSIRVCDSYYGSSLLVKMVDNEGHRFSTFYSGSAWNPKAGEMLDIKATVKKHDDYNDVNETVLNRVAVQV